MDSDVLDASISGACHVAENGRRSGEPAPVPEDTAACQDIYRAIGQFDAFCSAHGVSYFAIDDTLVGAMVYGDFIPDAMNADQPVMQVGMTRRDYCRLRTCAKGVCTCEPSTKRGVAASLDWRGLTVDVSVFDVLTDDYDIGRFQVRRITWLKRLAGKARGAARRALLEMADAVAARYEGQPSGTVANLLGGSDKPIPQTAIMPGLRHDFGQTDIATPADVSYWIETIALSDRVRQRIRLVQADSLQIMRAIDRVCRANGIGYFICSGTLLGAVRYKGFIPWDDDMDIGMLRADYDRFLECAQAQMDERFFVQTIATDPAVPYLYAKVRMNGTEYVTSYTERRSMHKGISVDIFPFDFAPVEDDAIYDHLRQANALIKAHKIRASSRVPEGMPHRRARDLTEIAAHAIMGARHALNRRKSPLPTYRAYVDHVSKYDEANVMFAASYVEYFTFIPLRSLLPYREMEFEGLSLLAPNDPDPLLSMQFGNYMEEPPPHLRRGHKVVAWKTSTGDGEGEQSSPGSLSE